MLLLLLACASSTLFGCAHLFQQAPAELPAKETEAESDLPTRDTIVLDIALAARPGEDSLMSLLWDNVDEIGAMDVTKRRELNTAGFRIGVTGSPPPPTLRTILRESIEHEMGQTQSWQPMADKLPGANRVTLLDGQDTLFRISHGETMSFVPMSEDGSGDGIEQSFENARCVIRLSAEKVQDGWIKLKFLPEIHHGANVNRPVVGDNGLQFKSSQRVTPLYDYQFEVTLNPGEVAIVGRSDSEEQRPGHRFFSADSGNGPQQKLITIRFLETSSVTGVRSSQLHR